MPDPLTILMLAAIGLIAGSTANWAIYNLGYFRNRPISPWGKTPEGAAPRGVVDRIPVAGWLFLRRETAIHGRGFWIRPMMIELAFCVFSVWFWQWQHGGGLVEARAVVVADNADLWFATQFLLVWLLMIATFIDFDEQTVPDWITIPGTIAGLMLATFAGSFHLPELVGTASGPIWKNVTFASPYPVESLPWTQDWRGLAAGLSTIGLWTWGLLPKVLTLRHGVRRGFRIMLASMVRPPRKTDCSIRTRQRRTFAFTWFILGTGFLMSLFTIGVFGAASLAVRNSLLTSLIGMAMGGGMIWLVRIIASSTLGQEAMGFGDVTLMAMVGTFLGWQASLMAFPVAIFLALFIAIILFIVTRNNAFAFGPYLAMASLLMILYWSPFWNDYAARNLFAMPGLLLGVLAASLVLMAMMLAGLRWLRGSDDELAGEE